MLDLVTSTKLVGFVGAPGAGKSWILTPFAEYCTKLGFLVTRHYCYLEPGDEIREKRITTDVFFGNLIAEVHDFLPSLDCPDVPRYSAGPEELVKLLAAACLSNPQQRILLIVDGLDHIERVLGEAATVTRPETRIVDELANLDLPDGVSIVIGSQPGDHLAPLRDRATFVEVPTWDRNEIGQLATRLGTIRRLEEFCDQEAIASFIDELHARSEGNPLYATYLCRETETAVVVGRAGLPAELVRQAPQHSGDLNNYYRYLVGIDGPDPVASILGYIDFAITRAELGELEPVVQPHLAATLVKLRPILTEVTGQGGLRIYHESFRRFIVGQVSQHEGHRAHVLLRISTWLESRGFPRDSRSYRYLLAYLFKQANYQAILDLVGVAFVSRSVENGYPAEAILDNLGIAADAARTTNDWPALCRIAELRKAVYACFEEKMVFAEYTRANLAVNGPAKVAEQLLFDGKPTRSKDEGLVACSLCDDAGVSPPWTEYLSLPGGTELNDREQAALADFHGQARTTPRDRLLAGVARWLRRSEEPPGWYARGLLSRFAIVHGVESLDRLLAARSLPRRALYQLHLTAALASKRAGDEPATKRHVAAGTALARDVRDARECLLLGAEPQALAEVCPNVEQLTRELLEVGHVPNEGKTQDWIAAVGAIAFLDPPRLQTLRDTIAIDGWYTAWMRFAIVVAAAVPQSLLDASGAEKTVLSGLRKLASERDPFRGKPRACDLYSIRSAIHGLWRQAMELIRTSEGLNDALKLLAEISDSTTTYLQRSPSGPLMMDALAGLAETLLPRSDAHSTAVNAIEQQVERTQRGLYGDQAGLEMTLAAAYATNSDSRAIARWEKACQCLTAYGYRKDITIFELINSIACLCNQDRNRTKDCLRDLQPLVASLDWRTDGKDTKGAVIHWYENLFSTTPAQAVVLLGRSLAEDGGTISWRLERCLEHVLEETPDEFAESLLSLWRTLPLSEERDCLGHQLRLIERILAASRGQGELAFQRCLAQVEQAIRNVKACHLRSDFLICYGKWPSSTACESYGTWRQFRG